MSPDGTAPTFVARVRPLVVPFATGVPLLGIGPVAVVAAVKPSGVAATALVLAAIAVGSLVAPAVGLWAEHHARHRHAQAAGLVVGACGYALLPFVTAPVARVVAALCIGAGSAASFTMTLCNVVRNTDQRDWERRLGVVIAVGQAGAFVGFVAVTALLARRPESALFAAAGCCVLAAGAVFAFVARQAPRPIDGADSPAAMLRAVARLLRPPLGVFMVGWTLTFTGSVALAGEFTPVLTAGFGVDAGVATVVLAVAFGLRAVLSVPAGHLAQRVGAARAMHFLQVLRLVACVALVVATVARPDGTAGATALVWNVVAVTAAIVLVASVAFVAVPSAALSVRLAGDGMAGALGAFFAAESVAIAVGYAAADFAADAAGVPAVPAVTAAIVVVGVLVLFAARAQFVGATRTDTTATDGSTVSS